MKVSAMASGFPGLRRCRLVSLRYLAAAFLVAVITGAPVCAGGFIVLQDWVFRGDDNDESHLPSFRIDESIIPYEIYQLVDVPDTPEFLALLGAHSERASDGDSPIYVGRAFSPEKGPAVRHIFRVSPGTKWGEAEMSLALAAAGGKVDVPEKVFEVTNRDLIWGSIRSVNSAQNALSDRKYEKALAKLADRFEIPHVEGQRLLISGVANLCLASEVADDAPAGQSDTRTRSHLAAARDHFSNISDPNANIIGSIGVIDFLLGEYASAGRQLRLSGSMEADPKALILSARAYRRAGGADEAAVSLRMARILAHGIGDKRRGEIVLAEIASEFRRLEADGAGASPR